MCHGLGGAGHDADVVYLPPEKGSDAYYTYVGRDLSIYTVRAGEMPPV